MTRRKRPLGGEWTAEDNAAQSRALAAADRYHERFGEPAPRRGGRHGDRPSDGGRRGGLGRMGSSWSEFGGD